MPQLPPSGLETLPDALVQLQLKTFQLPNNSFTAFRLIYASSKDINHLSTTIFLGTIPDVWVGGPQTGLLFGLAAKARKSVHRKFKSTSSTIRRNVRWFLAFLDDQTNKYEDSDDGDEDFNFISYNRRTERHIEDAYRQQGILNSVGGTGSAGDLPVIDTPQDASENNKEGDVNNAKNVSRNIDNAVEPTEGSELDEDDFQGDFVLNRRPRNMDNASFLSSESLLRAGSTVSNSRESLARFVTAVESRSEAQQNPSNEFPDEIVENGHRERLDIMDDVENTLSPGRVSSFEKLRSQSLSPGSSRPPSRASSTSKSASSIGMSPLEADSRNSSRSNSRTPIASLVSHISLSPPPIISYQPSGKVKFDIKSTLSKNSNLSKIQFALPQPAQPDAEECTPKQQYLFAENEHVRMLRKLHSVASRSKRRAKNTGLRLRLKVVDSIMSRFKEGEIIRVDRMLVLIEMTPMETVVRNASELGDIILDRWDEYFVVLRRTKELSLEVQLFDVSEHDFDGKPEHSITLTRDMQAEFYSTSDKSVCLTRMIGNKTIMYIFNARYPSVAFKWLFLIKEILRNDMTTVIGVQLAGLDLQMTIRIPDEMIRASLYPPKYLNVVEEEKGYSVGRGAILEYLRQELIKSLARIRNVNNDIDRWLLDNNRPWFCFKFYDRLEWAPASSRIFFIQNQLQSARAKLEFRHITGIPMTTKPPYEEQMERPHSIEGFLARVTDISGSEYSHLRPFYRIQYFYTSESILFFTQIFKGTPPSPDNAFMNENNDKSYIRSLLPEVYCKMTYPLDKNEHIPWLNSPEFAKMDREAVVEYERKVQQIVKADAMIDLVAVAEVRAVPMASVIAHHRYFQSFLWYSSPHTIEDEDIMDCAFEIVHMNGSRLKLMASSRVIRDEWVDRLGKLAKFWKSMNLEDLDRQLVIQHSNFERLGISEFEESNVIEQAKVLETNLATGNDRMFNIGSMTLATCVIQSGYLYLKHKKHSNFSQYFSVLIPGYLVIFQMFQRSMVSGIWKKTPYFTHYITILLSECYIYSGEKTWQDLVESSDFSQPGKQDLPRFYSDGWKSSEEDAQRCFTLWFGHKRKLKKSLKEQTTLRQRMGRNGQQSPWMSDMIKKLNVTGTKTVFLARSRQERECWVHKILLEMNRFSK